MMLKPPSSIFDGVGRTTHTDPTDEIYGQLQIPVRHFNAELFGNQLPRCVLTLTMNSKRTLGYFRPDGFNQKDGSSCDEIAMNPRIFFEDDLTYVCSIVVHEMAHQWKQRFGKKKVRAGYHCTEWGAKMDELGLPPSNTGRPGGKRTGYQMMHYIEKGGTFDLSCQRLLDQGYAMQWGFCQQRTVQRGDLKRAKAKLKIKFVCPECKEAVWGKPSTYVLCGDHKIAMEPVD